MQGPLQSLDQWDDFVQDRYDPQRKKEQFRQHTAEASPVVLEFYRLNHMHQTRDLVLQKRREYLPLAKRRMGVWEAMEYLNTLVDDSDPDIDLSQREHLLQTSEAIRADGHEDWFVLSGLIHDLGKILCLFGEPQWAVVGDSYPVGCAFSSRIVYPEYLESNPERLDPRLSSPLGVYEAGCGLANVHLSWGHDEYLYHVVTQAGCSLPEPALYMIRYHSFYPWHQEGAYHQFMDDRDKRMLPWVKQFNPYDLYSKSAARPDVEKLRPFYEELIAEYLPAELRW